MGEVVDLLMPKLGLTMTEGTVARWLAAPGARFAAGDAIVVIETDKIANEVEAPSAGELMTLLSSEGEVVPVGTPIARWQLDEISGQAAKAPPEPAATASKPTSSASSLSPPISADNRIVSTPYARRLAREASLDLSSISGSGPRGRIKAADVLQALEAQAAVQSVAPAPTAMQRAAAMSAAPALSFVSVDVDVSALRILDARLAGMQDRPFKRHAYLALACIKALHAHGETPVRLGVPVNGQLATIQGTARDTLSAIAARMAHIQSDNAEGDVAIYVVDGRARQLVPALPQGWRMALGVGGVRAIRSGDATHEMTMTIVHDATTDHIFAAEFLDRIAALLEEPLHLLAG
jgi:pyruvate dehydrogenase E2 component (dihydrolipoamide acetyltransferase)